MIDNLVKTIIDMSCNQQNIDVTALPRNGDKSIKIKIETRAHIEIRYIGKNYWMMFPEMSVWYLVPHDDLEIFIEEEAIRGKTFKSRSSQENWIWNFPVLPQKLLERSQDYRLPGTRLQYDLNDKSGSLVPFPRYRAETIYCWKPNGMIVVSKLSGFDDLEWNYLGKFHDPLSHIRERLLRSNT